MQNEQNFNTSPSAIETPSFSRAIVWLVVFCGGITAAGYLMAKLLS